MTAPDPAKYGFALDEIYALRAGAAYEATVLADVLTYATLPAGARERLTHAHKRLQEAARGGWDDAWGGLTTTQQKEALRSAGAAETLTRARWEDERV